MDLSAQDRYEKSKYKNRSAPGVKNKKAKKGKASANKGQSAAFRNAYQDMTGRYNGYFNAKLILAESVLKLTDNHKDDYAALLEVFPYEGGEKASSVHSQMDQVIEKASIDIRLHPNSKWLDDCYLLIGQANFFKGDYDKAIESLDYVNRQFGDRIRISEHRSKERGLRDRSYPGVSGNAKAGVGGQSIDAKKVKEKLKAELDKERKTKAKEKASDRKDTIKDKEKANKERAKQIEQRNKAKAKESARRKSENDKLKKLKGEKRKSYMAEIKARREAYDNQRAAEKEEAAEEKAAKLAEKEAQKAEEEAAKLAEEEEKLAQEEAAKKQEEAEKVIEETDEPKKLQAHETVDKYKAKTGVSHKPARFDALVWLAKTYLQMDKMGEALTALEKASRVKKTTKKQRAEIYSLFSQYHLENDDAEQAQITLSKAIDNTKGKRSKARLHYVKGQLAMEDKNYDAAIDGFNKVVKSKPARYDMEFNARLSIVRAKIKSGDFNAKDADRYFNKMLKDEKNDEYQDQIYFAMSEMELENGNVETALELLAKSASANTGNNEQKALTYLKVAELYYDQESYLQSAYYYDSTSLFLPEDYPDRENILERKETLMELAKYVNLVETEDSLQMIAGMSEGKRNRFLDDMIADLEQQAIAEEQQAEFLESGNAISAPTINSPGNDWYFYNETARSIGYNDFQSSWGGRPLQDDWRRNATESGFSGDVASIQTADEQTNELLALVESGELNREYFLSKLPLTPEAITNSDNKIAYALFQIGNVYKDNLNSPDKAQASYEELLRRFPNSEYTSQTHYTLYLLKTELGDTAGANVHKNYLLNNDPDSVFAKLLENPEYVELAQNQNMMQKSYYEETYQMYLNGQFDEAKQRTEMASKQFNPNVHAGQYALLSAMMVGETKERSDYITALKAVVLKYSEDPVKAKAEEILSFLQVSRQKETTKNNIYNFDPGSSHYFVIAFDRFVESLNKTINKVDDYNTAEHKLSNLKVTQMLLNPQNQIILVKTFKDGEKAMDYYNKFSKVHSALLKEVDTSISFKFFPISKKNFTQYFKSKDMDLYNEFFEDNYLD